MDDNGAKQVLENSFKKLFFGDDESSGLVGEFDVFNDCSIVTKQSSDKFTHPSVLFACIEAVPMEPEEAFLYEAQIGIYVTTVSEMTEADGQLIDSPAIHKERIGRIERALADYVKDSTELEYVKLHRIEPSKTESLVEDRHWTDVQTSTLYFQIFDSN